jgi:RNA polymerase sigma-70 factor (ECF subfamily)
MTRVQSGDHRALELLVQRWWPRLRAFLYRLTGDSDTDDLVQETFFRIHTARASWNPAGNFAAWILTIARRLAIDGARARARRPARRAADLVAPGATTTLFGKIPDNAPTPYTALSNLELGLKLEEALKSLPGEFREAVVLCDLQRLSYEEAAAVASVPAKTISSRLARGREKLRAALESYWRPAR